MIRIALAACAAMACSKVPPVPQTGDAGRGKIVVAVTVDWEGVSLAPDAIDAIDALRKPLGAAPLTHFVTPSYFTKATPLADAGETIAASIHHNDELAVHLHAWRSLIAASGIEPKLTPSFESGSDKLMQFEDGDVGFDTDLDAYSVADLRAIVRTERALLARTGAAVSPSFRAGGFLGTPKVLEAIRAEGFTVDASAGNYQSLLSEPSEQILSTRIAKVWPTIEVMTQPFAIHTPGGELVEMPCTAFATYTTTAKVVAIFDAAHAQLKQAPDRDVFVTLGLDMESAAEFAPRFIDAFKQISARPELARELVYVTVQGAAARARRTFTP